MEPNIHTAFTKKYALSSRLNYYLSASLLVVADYLAIAFAALCACLLRDEILLLFNDHISPLTLRDIYIYGIVPSIFLLFIAYADLYTRRIPFWQYIGKLFKICLYVNLLIVIFTYFIGKAENISRLYMGLFWILSFLSLSAFRYLSKRLFMAIGIWQIPVIIVGAGKTAELLAKTFEKEPGLGYTIYGLIEDAPERPLIKKYPRIGTFNEAEKTIAESGVQNVILATPGLKRNELIKLICRIQPYVRNLTVVPDLFEMPMSNITVDTLYSEKTILLNLCNNLARKRNRWLKRIFDLLSSILGTIMISPILLAIAIMIYMTSPGPVIFAHTRIGTNGKAFPCYKFRTMVKNAQEKLQKYLKENPEAKAEWDRDFKLKNDPRITKIGAILRKTSLDELPQLLNVIKGEMSLVGPRPIIEKEIAKYGDYIHDYYLVHPGMTGYWQVSGRNDVDYGKRVRMDAWYVRNWSLWQDIVILIKTVKVVLGRDGAY